MDHDILLTNYIHKNVFSQGEIDLIYSGIDLNEKKQTTTVDLYAQKVWFINLPEKIKDTVTKLARGIYQQNVNLEEISFARYSKEYGQFPNLTPHYDNTFLEQRVTIDVQLRSNIDWPIVIQGREFTLKDNEALTFSGTHQVHWRKNQIFKDDDFIEMLFCHFSLEDKKIITIEDKIKIEKRMMEFSNKFSVDLIKQLDSYKNAIKGYTYE
jgi:hypothetical protein